MFLLPPHDLILTVTIVLSIIFFLMLRVCFIGLFLWRCLFFCSNSITSFNLYIRLLILHLNMIIKETRRLYPPIPFVMKKAEEEMMMKGLIIPAGTDVEVSIIAVHTTLSSGRVTMPAGLRMVLPRHRSIWWLSCHSCKDREDIHWDEFVDGGKDYSTYSPKQTSNWYSLPQLL